MPQYEFYDFVKMMNPQDFNDVLSLMERAFPAEERRNAHNQRALLQNPFYRLTVLRTHEKVSAFFAWWDFPAFCFGEHFAVDDSLRGQGVGGDMLDLLTSQTQNLFVLEVEPPDATVMATRRIGFYQRHGFKLNTYPYLQMPLNSKDAPTPLMLMTRPDVMDENTFEQVRKTLYREVYALPGF